MSRGKLRLVASGEGAPTTRGQEDRRRLFEEAKPVLVATLATVMGLDGWRDDIVAIVADVRDALAAEAVRACGNDPEDAYDCQAYATPLAVCGIVSTELAEFLRTRNPQASSALTTRAPDGHATVVVFGSGGVTIVYAPIALGRAGVTS